VIKLNEWAICWISCDKEANKVVGLVYVYSLELTLHVDVNSPTTKCVNVQDVAYCKCIKLCKSF